MSHINITFDRYASYKHCIALHFGDKRTRRSYIILIVEEILRMGN